MAKESLLESEISHIVILMTLSLFIIKEFISDIYPKDIIIVDTKESTSVATYLFTCFY